MIEHTTEVQVRWSDVDPAGVVFYPRFFQWYDLGCESLFASLGLPWPEAFPKYQIVGVPIVESGSKFMSPARPCTPARSPRTCRDACAAGEGPRPLARPMYTRAAPAPRGAGGEPIKR